MIQFRNHRRTVALIFRGLVSSGMVPTAGQGQTPSAASLVMPQIEVFDARARAVRFGCDVPAGNICYFQVQSRLRNFAQRFAVSGGQRATVTGVIPGADQYLVTVNQVPPLAMDCRLAPDPRKFCKVGVVGPDYNN